MTNCSDTRWKWAVLVGSFIALFITDGWLCTFGLVYSNLLFAFDQSRVATSYVPAFLYGVPMIVSLFACSAVTRVGCRSLMIFAGIVLFASFILISLSDSLVVICIITGLLTSVGLKCALVSALVAVTYWFEEGRRGGATGIAVSGSGIGSIVLPHLIDYLMGQYLWRGTFMIMGAICLHVLISGCLYRPFPYDIILISTAEDGPKKMRDYEDLTEEKESYLKNWFCKSCQLCREIFIGGIKDAMRLLKIKEFLFYCFVNFMLYLWIDIPYLFTYDWASEHLNLNRSQNAWLLSIQGMSLTVGLLVIGYLVDSSAIFRPNLVYGICMVICGTSTFLMPYCPNYEILVACCSIFSFFGSATFVLPVICVGEVVGIEWSVAGLGIIHFIQGISILIGTPIGGWIRDVKGSYDLSFYISGLSTASIGMLISIFSIWLKFKTSEKEKYESVDQTF